MMYLIIDLEEEELKSICKSKQEVIDFAQEYYDYLFAEDDDYEEDKKPNDWNMALDFLEANSRYVLDLDKREDYKVNRLIDEIKELRDIADEADNPYAIQDMEDCINSNILFPLENLPIITILRAVKIQDYIGINTLEKIRDEFKDICINYGIREEGDV